MIISTNNILQNTTYNVVGDIIVKLRKGDIVGRKSYNKDIAFVINNIIKNDEGEIAILKGLILRIEADAPVEDLELLDDKQVINIIDKFNKELERRRKKEFKATHGLERNKERYGRILHLDGDKKYSEKSERSMGLDVVVKNIPESKQPQMIYALLSKYTPDILIVTGHDGMIKKGHNYNDIYNYRNSKYFIETVKRARRWEFGENKLAIFAGACQSYYEAIMKAGANFASSPARILIDFKDPLVVAEKIAKTDSNKFISIKDIADDLRDGEKGISGSGTMGKKSNNSKM